MSDIKLFRIDGTVEELSGTSVAIEKTLQTLIEKNLEVSRRSLARERAHNREDARRAY